MREPKVVAIFLSLVFTVGCSGMTGLTPTGPSQSVSASQSVRLASPPQAPSGPVARVITGVVNPVASPGERCYFNLYACEAYDFSVAGEGGVDVTLAWEGGARDLMIQLYRADVGLIHEDLAPRGGASRITFRRPDLAPMDYQFRVVSMQKDVAIPFTLTYTQFDN